MVGPESLTPPTSQTPQTRPEITPPASHTFPILAPININGTIEYRTFNVTIQSQFGDKLSDLIFNVKNSKTIQELIHLFWHEGNGFTTTLLFR